MKGEELVACLKRHLSLHTDRALAEQLGITEISVGAWRRQKSDLSPRQVCNLIKSASKAAISRAHDGMLRPIVEYFPIDAVESAGGIKYELFATGKDGNPLHVQLKESLSQARGVYIFYDSRGRALYVGKAKDQSLWREIKNAFNRQRDTQTVYRVRHPTRRQNFKTAYELARQPARTQLKLNDLAAYLSVYEVEGAMINRMEALLVRGFANDILNVRMERM